MIRSICALIALSLSLGVAGAARGEAFDYGDYGKALARYVDANGMVNYAALKDNPASLTAFLGQLKLTDRAAYEKWPQKDRIAFWLNAYNGLTLRAIIDHYPIQSSWLKSRFYPKNSIRQIDGVWDKLKFTVMGREMTLDGIEHATLRKEFHEPRIHMALVCAAMGCPPLRNEPYLGATLAAQLDDQARKFLRNPLKFSIDPHKKSVEISPIFKWFGEDFEKAYGETTDFAQRSVKERAVLHFIAKYAPERDAEFLRSTPAFDLSYKDYDWSLNEQAARP